jgi:hypothetical protein
VKQQKMNPLAREIGNALLVRHKQLCSDFTGNSKAVNEDRIRDATISYTELLRVVGAPKTLARSIGEYLEEVAAWCRDRNLPPVNALAVNGQFGRPGSGYYTAPGCGDWDQEVRDCIACRRYPPSI